MVNNFFCFFLFSKSLFFNLTIFYNNLYSIIVIFHYFFPKIYQSILFCIFYYFINVYLNLSSEIKVRVFLLTNKAEVFYFFFITFKSFKYLKDLF